MERRKKLAAFLSLNGIRQSYENMWFAVNVKDGGKFYDLVFCQKGYNMKGTMYFIKIDNQNNPRLLLEENGLKEGDFSVVKLFEDVQHLESCINNEIDTKSNFIDDLRSKDFDRVYIMCTSMDLEFDFKFLTKIPAHLQPKNMNALGEVYKVTQLPSQGEENITKPLEYLFIVNKQENIDNLNRQCEEIIKKIISPFRLRNKTLTNFIQRLLEFIAERSGDLYVFSRSVIFPVFSILLVEPYVYKVNFEITPKEGTENWNVLLTKKVTVIEQPDQDTEVYLNMWIRNVIDKHKTDIGQMHKQTLDSRNKIKPTDTPEEMNYGDVYDMLWKTGHVPVIIEANPEKFDPNIIQVLKKFKSTLKIIILNKTNRKIENEDPQFCTLRDLDKDLRDIILQHPVKVQGRSSIVLKDLLNEESYHLITTRDIIRILDGRFNIGNEFKLVLNEFEERKLRKILFHPEVLQNVTSDVFVIISNSSTALFNFIEENKLEIDESKIYRYTRLSTETLRSAYIIFAKEADVQYIETETLASSRVHYFCIINTYYLAWIRSNGSIKNIKSYLVVPLSQNLTSLLSFRQLVQQFYFDKRHNRAKEYNIEDMAKKMSTVIGCGSYIINAIPGSGKSTVMDYLCTNVSTNEWIIKIDLTDDHMEYFVKQDSFLVASKILQYFNGKMSGNVIDLNKLVFKWYLDSKNIVVLVDGFDEIKPAYQNKALSMISCLHKSKFSVCITTRPCFKTILEEKLDLFSLNLIPFTETNEKHFLIKVFMKKYSDQVGVTSFVDELFGMVENLKQCRKLVGYPLLGIILAVVFDDDCRNFLETRQFVAVNFDLLYLYRKYIDQKIHPARGEYETADLREKYKLYLSLNALKILFDEADLKELQITKQLKMLGAHLQDDGIIVQTSTNVKFVHRTFAEYLAAEWLAQNWEASSTKALLKRIFDPNYVLVRNLFDRILASGNIFHLAIIDNEIEEAVKIIENNPKSIITTDKGGRTFLHLLAAWHVCKEIDSLAINISIQEKSNNRLQFKNRRMSLMKKIPSDKFILGRDKVLNCTAVDYGILSDCIVTADLICENLSNLNYNIITLNVDITKLLDVTTMYIAVMLNTVAHKKFIEVTFRQMLSTTSKNDLKYQVATKDMKALENIVAVNKKSIDAKGILDTVPLHWATLSKRLNVVNLLLDYKANPNAKDNCNMTPLHYAIINGNLKIAKLLLKNGAFPDVTDAMGSSPTYYAVIYNNVEALKLLLRHGADTNQTKDREGNSLLHSVAYWGRTELAELLLKSGVDSNLRDTKMHQAPIHLAVSKGFNTNIVKMLLKYDANIISIDSKGMTPLHVAAYYGHLDVVQFLLDNGADANIKDREYCTALEYAVLAGQLRIVELLLPHMEDIEVYPKVTILHAAVMGGNLNILRMLLSKNLNVEVRCDGGFSVLQAVVIQGNVEMAKLLLEHGADVHAKTKKHWTSLHLACYVGNYDMCSLLISNGADVAVYTTEKYAPLHVAAFSGHLDTAELLLSNKANIDAIGEDNKTPLHYSIFCDDHEVAALFIKAGANVNAVTLGETALHVAVQQGNLNIVALLLEHNANINEKNDQDQMPIHLAALVGHIDVLDYLCSKDIDINARANQNYSILHCAVVYNNLDVAEYVINRGVDMEAKDEYGITALYLASIMGNLNMVKLLVSRGANVYTRCEYGRTALHAAVLDGQEDVALFLLTNPDDIYIKDDDQKTPLNLAHEEHYTHLVTLLCNKVAALRKLD